MEQLRSNCALMAEIDRIAEVAGYLWTKGWAERNGGNISVNVTSLLTPEDLALPALAPAKALPEKMKALAGHVFYVTGTGKRMRYVAPFENGSLIRVAADGLSYEIIAEQPIQPTSELPSHLMMHNCVRSTGRDNRVVLHTHPTDLIGMTHCKRFLNSDYLTKVLWSQSAESLYRKESVLFRMKYLVLWNWLGQPSNSWRIMMWYFGKNMVSWQSERI